MEYRYKADGWLNKLFLSFSLIFLGIVLTLYIPTWSEFTALLLSLPYICGFALLFLDTIPVIYRSIKGRGKSIIIDEDSISIIGNQYQSRNGQSESDQSGDSVISMPRKEIARVVFKSHPAGKYIISTEDKLEDVADDIHKMSGRRLIISSGKKKLVIYLELLGKDFLNDFIAWYQEETNQTKVEENIKSSRK